MTAAVFHPRYRSDLQHRRVAARRAGAAERAAGRARPMRGAVRRSVIVAATLSGLPLFAACSAAPDRADAPAAQKSAAGEAHAGAWQVLFDGRDLGRWRGYRREDVPAGWHAEDGALTVAPAVGRSDRGDLVTRDEFGGFELELEWKISEGGNSGIFYRANEEHDNIYESGPEMQVLDNGRHRDGENPLTSAGSNFALHAPSRDVTRPVGEWNHARIVARGGHVEHWLNGEKVVEYEQWSDDWQARVAASKFAAMPGYGKSARGRIGLQDHGDRVWFRNIRIRRLDAAR